MSRQLRLRADCTLDLAKYLDGELEQVNSYLPNRICSLGSGALQSESWEAKHHLFLAQQISLKRVLRVCSSLIKISCFLPGEVRGA